MGKFTLRESARNASRKLTGQEDAADIGSLLENASKSSECSDFELLDDDNHVVNLSRFGKDGDSYWRVS